MQKEISRRSFLKTSLIGGAAAASGLLLPEPSQASSSKALCTLFDLRKCIGCEACVKACRDINDHKFPVLEGSIPERFPRNRVQIADWTSPEKRAVRNRLTPFNWLTIQTAAGSYSGNDFELHIPRRCMHCHNAPCVNLCPFGAAFAQRNGTVLFHPQICMGGGKCKDVCPWKIPERQSGVGSYLNVLPNFAGNGIMYKCDRCFDRVQLGELPACVEACPLEVQRIGPRPEIVKRAHRLAEEIDGYIYGETENGGTNTIYVSPIPFEVLNETIAAGPGKPHLENVPDSMGIANRLASALIAGPLIGAIVAALRLQSTSEESVGEEE